MSTFVENVVLSLEKYEKMKAQIAELTKEKLKNENIIQEDMKLIEKFYRPFYDNHITKEQLETIVKQLENANFTVTKFEDAISQKITVILKLDTMKVLENEKK